MKITALNDIRKFKAGDIFDFTDIISQIPVILVGENGSGKSTLIHALRGSLEERYSDGLYEDDFKSLSTNFKIEHDYDKIFFLDSIKDNPMDLNVSYDAVKFLETGGLTMLRSSHGESAFMLINKMWDEITKYIGKNKDSKILVVFDEADKGFSIKHQAAYKNILFKINDFDNMNILVISHNPFLLSKLKVCYNIHNKEFCLSDEYILEQTNYILTENNSNPE